MILGMERAIAVLTYPTLSAAFLTFIRRGIFEGNFSVPQCSSETPQAKL